MLSRYARNECWTIAAMAVTLAVSCWLFGLGALAILPLALGACALLFYRDPHRISPKDRNVAVSPADGKISSIHEVAHFEPFGGPAVCVRVFLSVFDVHVNYCPCHAEVFSITHKPGEHMSVLNPRSAEANEAITVVFNHPTHKVPCVAVRQIAGLLARTVHCALAEGQVVQRGAKLGIMKLGSSAELYLPVTMDQVLVRVGQRVVGAITPLAVLPAKPAAGEASGTFRLSKSSSALAEASGSYFNAYPPVPEEADTLAAALEAAPPPDTDDIEDARPAPHHPMPTPTFSDTAIVTLMVDEPAADEASEGSQSCADLTDHAITQVMAADDAETSQNLTSSADGEFLTARMENAGTDLMLHPAEHGEENKSLAASLAGLRPEAGNNGDDDTLLEATLPAQRQADAAPEDSGDWQIVPTSKKTKKPKADGLLWEEAN